LPEGRPRPLGGVGDGELRTAPGGGGRVGADARRAPPLPPRCPDPTAGARGARSGWGRLDARQRAFRLRGLQRIPVPDGLEVLEVRAGDTVRLDLPAGGSCPGGSRAASGRP
jgi:hypothetical protein